MNMHVWCIYECSLILDSNACVYDAFINVPQSLTLMPVCMMHISMILGPWLWCMCVWCISMILDLDPEACMYVWFLTLMFVCMCDAYVLDPDTCDHDACMHVCMILDSDVCMHVRCICSWSWCTYILCIYPWPLILIHAFINFPRSLTLMHVCMIHISMVLDLDSYVCVYDVYIYGFGPWSWSMHVCIILDPDVCMHVRCICSWSWYMWPWCTYLSLFLIHACMMHLSTFLDPRLWCMYVWCIHLLSLILTHLCMMHVFMMRQICHLTLIHIYTWCMYARCIYICSLIMMHMCMMHTSVIFNPWLCCMCVWCGWNFETNQPTNEQWYWSSTNP